MKTFSKISLLMEVIILSLIIAGFNNPLSKKAKSLQYDGEISVTGTSATVTVFRDERGMPHIYAANEHDLYFAVGYISAQERLWQMDLIRRSATGSLSEIFGKSFVQTDLLMRSLNIAEKSRMVLKNEDPVILECLKAFTEGVNNYITSGFSKLPAEFRILSYKPGPWKLEDITCIIGYMGWNLGSRNLSSEVFDYRLVSKLGPEKAKELIPDWKIDDAIVFPHYKIGDSLLSAAESFVRSGMKLESLGIVPVSGSNNWAVSGRRSETGKPLLSNDMHLPFGSPGIWMQMHQVVPGQINVTGVLIPGEPFIIAGHNERIAWGMTNLMVDDIDLFCEKVNPDNFDQYFYNGQWREITLKEEVIKVRGGREDTMTIRYTHRGPVISSFENVEDAALSLKWAGNDPSDEIKAVYLINRASGWKEFRSALSTFRTVSQNFVYADTEGNIGINTGGAVPLRKASANIIRSGETDEFDWKGYIPFEDLPSAFNPDQGYVSSANNKTVDDSYPYYISTDFAVPYRINRIRQMLEEKELYSIDDFKRMILDQHSVFAAMTTPLILRLNGRREELTSQELNALYEFSDWDYEMKTDLIAPSLLEFFRMNFRKNLLADDLGELYGQLYYGYTEYFIYRLLKTGYSDLVDNINTPQIETIDDIVLQSFKDCVSAISGIYGNNMQKWKWGNIHKLVIGHPLGSVRILNNIFHFNSDQYSVGGSDHTVSPFFSMTGEFRVNYGASERHILNTADWDDSYTVIPTGESGIAGSEFYLSQTKSYMEGKFYRDLFSEEAVRAGARYTLKLVPGK